MKARRIQAAASACVAARQRWAAQSALGAVGAARASREDVHQWPPLPSYWTAEACARAWPGLAWPGLAITPPNAFAGTPDGPAAIRIPLGGGSDRRQLALGLARLSAPLAARPQDAAAVI